MCIPKNKIIFQVSVPMCNIILLLHNTLECICATGKELLKEYP